MIKKFVILVLLVILVSNKPASAIYPVSGMELKYKWISDSTWKVTLIYYIPCEYTSPLPIANTTEYICGFDTCNYLNNNNLAGVGPFLHGIETLPDGSVNGGQMKKPCPTFITMCDSMVTTNARSFHICVLEALFTIPEKCGMWTWAFRSKTPAWQRDSAITNIPDGHWFYIEDKINIVDTTIKNSSAELINPFPFYIPINQPVNYSFAANDIDGDSLVYHLVKSESRSFSACNVNIPISYIPYIAPFTVNEPFNTGGTFHWDSTLAIMSFTSPIVQDPLITLVIDEYRNGVWVGNTMRDIPFVVLPISNPLPENTPLPATWSNTQMQGVDTFYACAGSSMSFCTLLSSADSNAVIQCNSTIATGIPNATLNYTNLLTDSVTACISWAPTFADTGWHVFTITAKDTTCPALGVNSPQTFAYRIYVSTTVIATGNTKLCEGDTLTLSAQGGNGVFNWQTISGSTNSFQCLTANCDSIKVYPTQNTVYVVSSGVGSVYCLSSDTIKVNYYSDFTIHATDTILCADANTLTLYSNTQGNNTVLNYSWLPLTNIQGSNTQSNIVIIPSTIDYILTVSDTANCFAHTDIGSVKYDKDFNPVVSVNDTSICAGDGILFTITGANNASILWSPTINISGATDNPMMAWPVVNTAYKAIVTSNVSGCMMDTTINIKVSYLFADAGPDKIINSGEPVTIGGANMHYDANGIIKWFPDEYIQYDYLEYPTVFPPKTTTYYVVIENADHTCISTDTVNVIVKCGNVFMPNAFNPNSEWTENKTFGLNNQMMNLKYFKIYNRRGNLVFSSNDVNRKWDGTYKGSPAATDTYYWELSGICGEGQSIFQKGDVILIR